MPKAKIAGIGMYVPKNVIKNDDLQKYMDTNDEWIQANTGIKESSLPTPVTECEEISEEAESERCRESLQKSKRNEY